MLVCDVCKKNKATRKITYPTMIPIEYVAQYHEVELFRATQGYKREDVEYDICQQCWYMLAKNRDYTFQLAKEMIYNKVNELAENEE